MVITEQNIIDVELAINNLVLQKEKLVFDKKDNELKNATLRNQVRSGGKIHDVKYKKICDQQIVLRKDTFAIEKAISELNIQIMNKSTFKDQLRMEFNKQKGVNIKQKLIDVRDHYINFASDKSRVASMRSMGAEFAEKVESLIKQL